MEDNEHEDVRDVGTDAGIEDEGDQSKGIRTSTKVVVVAAGWVLLTLFLVGRFSDDADRTATARLDTAGGREADGHGEPAEVVDEGEATGADGDGIIEAGEGIAEGFAPAWGDAEAAAGAGVAGDAGGGSGSKTYAATPTDAAGGSSAAPGAGPAGAAPGTPGSGGGSTPITTSPSGSGASGGGSSEGSTATTTSTTPAGGGGGGGAGTTTTTAQGQPAASPITFIVQARENKYVYPAGYSSGFTVPVDSRIRFDNDEAANKSSVRHTFTISGGWDSGDLKRQDAPVESPPLAPGTYSYACKYHGGMKGTFTVS